ncbi:MAG: GerMN domain-containing protein [Acidobacteriota bacterium]
MSVALLLGCRSPKTETVSHEPPASAGSVTVVGASETTEPDGEGATAQPPVVATSAASENITIESVEIANPLVVTGHARTFENSVSLRLRDARGGLIGETSTTSTGEMGMHNPYRAALWVTRDPGGSITVEALEYSAKDGAEQSLVAMDRPFALQPVSARLYFPDRTCTRVAAQTRRIPKSLSAARLLVEALIAGPTATERASGAAAAFPEGSRVESVNLRDGILTVDFNARLQNVGGACQAGMIRQSVTETLKALPAVKKVVITAGGNEAHALQP